MVGSFEVIYRQGSTLFMKGFLEQAPGVDFYKTSCHTPAAAFEICPGRGERFK